MDGALEAARPAILGRPLRPKRGADGAVESVELVTVGQRRGLGIPGGEPKRYVVDVDVAGRRVVVTAGPTYEDLDPVRFIGNRSSGRMGFAVANAAAPAGWITYPPSPAPASAESDGRQKRGLAIPTCVGSACTRFCCSCRTRSICDAHEAHGQPSRQSSDTDTN